jgi:hypothetical protein
MSLAPQLETRETAQLVHQIMPALEELNLTQHLIIDADKFLAIRNNVARISSISVSSSKSYDTKASS